MKSGAAGIGDKGLLWPYGSDLPLDHIRLTEIRRYIPSNIHTIKNTPKWQCVALSGISKYTQIWLPHQCELMTCYENVRFLDNI